MKTKFFKKLSFVLVVAMVLSLFVPAAGAFAAKAPKLNSTKKYLHLGVEDKDEFNFNIANKQKGWKYEWESLNEDVAEVNAKNGVATATGVGSAKISVTITDKEGTLVKKLTATVVVRDNIKTVKISNPVEKIAVAEEYDFNRSYTTVSGSTKKTSAITRWVVEPAKGASINDKGVFVATEAGEYTVTANSFQSKAKYTAWLDDPVANADYKLATDSIKVLVAGSMVSAKQIDGKTLEVTFDSAMVDVDKNITVSQMVGTTKVKQLVKEVKMDEAKKVATVTVYINFTAGSTYVVDYTDLEPVSFVAATSKVEDVTAIQITTSKAVLNKATKVEYKLLNADGVNISTPDLEARVTMKSSDGVGTYFNSSTKEVTIFNKDATTTITATFNTYKYDTTGNQIGNSETTAVIVGVDADATNIEGLNAWTIVNDGNPDFGKVSQKLAADDKGYRLFVEFNTKTGSDTAKVNSKDKPGDFSFTTSDKNYLIVDALGTLFPVKEGNVVVVVNYGTGAEKTPIGAIPITISAKRGASVLTLSTYSVTLSNSPLVNDSTEVEITLKDQLGADFSYTKYNVEELTAPSDKLADVTTVANGIPKGTGKVVFKGVGTKAGDYAYKITVEDKVAVVNVKIQDASDAAVVYHKLALSATEVDTKAEATKDNNKAVTFELFGYNSNGVKVSKEDLSAADFYVNVDAPKSEWNVTKDVPAADATFTASIGKYVVATATSPAAIVKAPTGSYKVSAFALKDHDDNAATAKVFVAVDVAYFTVTDTQVKPIVSEIKTRIFDKTVSGAAIKKDSIDATLFAVVNDCLKFTLNGTETAAVVKVDAFGNASEFNIQKVVIREYIDGAYIDHEITVGLTVSKK